MRTIYLLFVSFWLISSISTAAPRKGNSPFHGLWVTTHIVGNRPSIVTLGFTKDGQYWLSAGTGKGQIKRRGWYRVEQGKAILLHKKVGLNIPRLGSKHATYTQLIFERATLLKGGASIKLERKGMVFIDEKTKKKHVQKESGHLVLRKSKP